VLASHRAREVTAHTVMVEEKIDERDIVGIVTPMFHVAALNIMFQPAILAGATTTLLSKWEPREFASMVRETGMTANFMVPTQASMVMQDPEFDAADFALKPVRLANCAGLLFANLDDNAANFEQEYPGLEQILLDCLPGLEGFSRLFECDYDIAANWKIVVDNFSEGYHIPVAHRKLSQVLDIGAGDRASVEQRYAFFESRSKQGYEGFEVEPGSPYRSWTLWPNTCMLSLPGCANLIVIRMAQNGPDRCAEHVDLLADSDGMTPVLEAIRDLFTEQFNAEDIALVESVHRGLKSLGYDQGRYVVDESESWYSESGLHRFHRQLLQALEEL